MALGPSEGELDQELEALLCDPGPTLCLLWASASSLCQQRVVEEVPLEPLSRQPEPKAASEDTASAGSLMVPFSSLTFVPCNHQSASHNYTLVLPILELHIDGSLWDVLLGLASFPSIMLPEASMWLSQEFILFSAE